MSNRPLSEAKDQDLRGAEAAMERANRAAEELAKKTGTKVIVSESAAKKN